MDNARGKVIQILIISLLLSLTFVNPIDAARQVTVSLNGKVIEFNADMGQPFIDENERTQVPFRIILEKIGAKVTWNRRTMTATAIKQDIRVDVPIGESYIIRNGEKIINDSQSRIVEDRTYLPIRVVLEAFDYIVKWDPEKFRVVITTADSSGQLIRIPAKYDLRTRGKLTPVKNQLDSGACWAFASLGAIESSLLPKERWDFSEDHLSLNHGFNLAQAEGGNYAVSLSYLTRWSGPVTEEEDAFYDGINNPNATVAKHVQEARFIPDKDYSGIKVAIMTYGAVQSSLYLNDYILDKTSKYYNKETAAYYYNGNYLLNHDIIIVGWDDAYAKENFKITPKENGAFIVKNSYGTDFGQKGYFYVSYEDVHIGTRNVVYTRIDPPTNYDHIYQADWLGYIGQIGYGVNTAYFANVYTAKAAQSLEAVSFYATDENTTYEVYVVKQFNKDTDLNTRKMVATGGFEYGGYYTVDLDESIVVEGNFAIVVKVTTPASKYPVAAEFMKKEPWLNTVNIKDGRGYISVDGKKWENTETMLESNVCLKAFTKDINN